VPPPEEETLPCVLGMHRYGSLINVAYLNLKIVAFEPFPVCCRIKLTLD